METVFETMRNKILLLTVLLSFPGLSGDLLAQTAEEFESRGLSHFRKAYYEAAPRDDKAQVESEFALAEKALINAIQRRPHRLEAYLYLGRTYFVQKKYAQATETYRAALKVDPHKKEVYLKLASAQEMGGDYAGALYTLKRLRALETEEHALRIVDEFIQELQRKAQSE
jgi:cytochrome c-type biogenesis protein CcmH/NrfG